MPVRLFNEEEKAVLRYLLEFGASSEYRLDECHYRYTVLKALTRHDLIEFNPGPRTYKLTAEGRKQAELLWPWIKKTKSPKSGAPKALMQKLREFIKNKLGQNLTRGSALYGCGDHGCAFKLKNRKEVLKITTDPAEVECAIGILELQEKQTIPRKGYPLPIVYQAGFVDIRSPFVPTYRGCLIASGYYVREHLEDIELTDLIGGSYTEHVNAFKISRGRRPNGSWELWKEKENQVHKTLDQLATKIEKDTGLELFDYWLDLNWGKRKLPDGSHQIVYRDLSCIV